MKALAELIKANPKEAMFLLLIGATAGWLATVAITQYDMAAEIARMEGRTGKIEDNYQELLSLRERVRHNEVELARMVGRGE